MPQRTLAALLLLFALGTNGKGEREATVVRECVQVEKKKLNHLLLKHQQSEHPDRPCLRYSDSALHADSFPQCGIPDWQHDAVAHNLSRLPPTERESVVAVVSTYHDWALGFLTNGGIQIIEFAGLFRTPAFGARAWGDWEGGTSGGLAFCQCNQTRLAQVRDRWKRVARLLPTDMSQSTVVSVAPVRQVHCDNLLQQTLPFRHWHTLYHHDAHAAHGFYTSPFQRALIVSLDGLGTLGHSFLFYAHRAQRSIRKLESPVQKCAFAAGFWHAHETYRASHGVLMGCTAVGTVVESLCKKIARSIKYSRLYNKAYNRAPKQKVPFDWKQLARGVSVCDFAASAQRATERVLLEKLSKDSLPLDLVDGVVLTGGVFHNFKLANAVHVHLALPVWVSPVPDDAGLSAGALLVAASDAAGAQEGVFLGRPFEGVAGAYEAAFRGAGWSTGPVALAAVAQGLGQGHVGVWMMGQQELGNQCRGHRCLLASPAPRGHDRLRAITGTCAGVACTYLTTFVPEAHVTRVFDVRHPQLCPFCAPVTVLPSVARAWPHVGLRGTAHVHVVRREANAPLHRLLEEVAAVVGLPVLLGAPLRNAAGTLVNSAPEVAEVLRTSPGLAWAVVGPDLMAMGNESKGG